MPTLWASGLWGRWDYLAMDLLGSSLDRLYRKSGKNVMDMRSVCSIAIQLVRPISPLLSAAAYYRVGRLTHLLHCTRADNAAGVYALPRRITPGYTTRELCHWSWTKTRNDLYDRFRIFKTIPPPQAETHSEPR